MKTNRHKYKILQRRHKLLQDLHSDQALTLERTRKHNKYLYSDNRLLRKAMDCILNSTPCNTPGWTKAKTLTESTGILPE